MYTPGLQQWEEGEEKRQGMEREEKHKAGKGGEIKAREEEGVTRGWEDEDEWEKEEELEGE